MFSSAPKAGSPVRAEVMFCDLGHIPSTLIQFSHLILTTTLWNVGTFIILISDGKTKAPLTGFPEVTQIGRGAQDWNLDPGAPEPVYVCVS